MDGRAVRSRTGLQLLTYGLEPAPFKSGFPQAVKAGPDTKHLQPKGYLRTLWETS